ncbi:MAG: N-acetylmuramoyl-L-alanine amidase [Deinococcota bacterium]
MYLVLSLLILSVLGMGYAQQRLVVNGRNVPTLTSSLVASTSYVEIASYAQALGALYAVDIPNGLASLQLADRIMTLAVSSDPAAAARDTTALRVNGQVLGGPAAVNEGGMVYVPVKAVAEALGGQVDFVTEQNIVAVVFERADVLGVRLEPSTGYDRIVLELSAPIPIETRKLPALDAVQFRLLRTDIASPEQLTGNLIRSGSVMNSGGHVDVRLTLTPGSDAEVFSTQQNGRTLAIIDVFPLGEGAPAAATVPSSFRIALDPGHGGNATGLEFEGGSEANLTLTLASQLADALALRGHSVEVTRSDGVSLPVSQRADYGLGQDLFISLHAANIGAGSINLFYLGDPQTPVGLNYAIFQNAENLRTLETDALRRRILLNLVPDLSLGERYTRALSRTLAQSYGVRTNVLEAAPLTVLAGAAGRGLLLEASPQDIASAGFADALASAIDEVLREVNN